MRFKIIVKATKDSEAGVMPREDELAAMVAIDMYGGAFRPEYDDLVQTLADELKIGLQNAGFGRVQLQFKPTDPIASLCAVGEGRLKTAPCTAFPVFSEFWW